MNVSEKLFIELQTDSRDSILSLLENAKRHSSLLKYSDYNSMCYNEMYIDNRYENGDYTKVKLVKDIKNKIAEQKETCQKCGMFFMNKRNNSIPKYDVIFAKTTEDAIMRFLGKKGFAIDRADLENRSLPDLKITNACGKTVAYIEVKFHAAPFVMLYKMNGRLCYEGSATLDYDKVEHQLELIDKLDAPTYYLHWLEYPCLKGVFFETSAQVKSHFSKEKMTYERMLRKGDLEKSQDARYTMKIYPTLLDMGDFAGFLEELAKLVIK